MTPSLCRRFQLPALLVGVSLLVSIGTMGCSSQTGSLDDYRKFDEIRNDLTPETAQMLMMEFATSAESLIQSRIPQIVETQSDAEVIRAVQSFGDGLLEGIRISAWRLQPVGAAFDSFVFVKQVKGFLGTREARVALGAAFPRVEQLVVDLEGILRLSIDEFLNQRGAYSEKTKAWVESNPIKEIDLVRPSPIPEVAETASRQITNAMAAVADVDFTLNSVYGRINTALAAMPQDFRRQLERAVRSFLRETLVVNALVGLARLGDGMKETAVAIAGVDERIGRVQVAIIDEVDRQRLETLDLMVETIALERGAVMADVRAIIQTELSGTISDFGGAADRTVDRAMSRLERLVIAILVVLIAAVVALAILFRSKRTARG